MKHTYLRVFFIAGMLIIFFNQNGLAQQISKADAKKAAYKNMVDSQHFIFEAQSASPLGRSLKNLTSTYEVHVSKDTLISDLPYFGTAFTAPIGQTKSPLNFTSTKFSYSVTPNRKKGWDVTIKIKGKDEDIQYSFNIFDNGNTSLIVSSASRQTISFNGYLKK